MAKFAIVYVKNLSKQVTKIISQTGLCFALFVATSFHSSANDLTGKQATTNPTRNVLILGDSLSAAYRLPTEQGWVSLAADRLKAKHPNIQLVNASVSGATTAAGLSRLPSLLETHNPVLVVLELGANDGLQGKPLNYINKNLSALIEQSIDSGSEVLLLGIRLPPNLGKRYTEPFFKQYETLAKKYKTQLVPFMLDGVAGNSNLMMTDGLHPNKNGQEATLEVIWPTLELAIAKTQQKTTVSGADHSSETSKN